MSVPENTKEFKSLEREIYQLCCMIGVMILKATLEAYDLELAKNRDKKIYRNKGKRRTTIKTIMGEVEYNRTMYQEVREDGTKRYVYLLDEAIGIGIGNHGFISELLAELVVKAVSEGTYRAASRSVSELTGQTISHTAIWNEMQQIGAHLDEQEKAAAELAEKGEGKGTLETKVLFEEVDGIFLKLQGKSREKYGAAKEMKVAIAYDGAENTGTTEKKRYRLTNKVATANFENTEHFRQRKEGTIASKYNIDEIEVRLANGDGAGWIKESIEPGTHFQLDHFHISQAITRWVADKEKQKKIRELYYSKQTDLMLEVIAAYSNSTMDEKERENNMRLYTYLSNNKDYLVPVHRRGLNLPEPPEGKIYRRMGTMESNIFTIIGNRMKGGRKCWSISGGNNLARILTLKATGRLTEAMDTLTSTVLPERYSEEIKVKMSVEDIPLSIGKGYDGFHKMDVPSSMFFLKKLAELRSI